MNTDLVIFSRDRENELLLTLRRMSEYALRVLVVHNSKLGLSNQMLPSNVTYIHAPGMNYGERAKMARNYLESDFCLVSSDDDGVIESSILQMENWLINNPKYSSVGGMCIGAFPYGGRVTASIAYSEMNNYELISRSVEDRLEEHMLSGAGNRPPRASLYRLYRRETMDKILEVFGECSRFSTPYVYEVCAELVSAWSGPTKYINHLYWIRNWQTEMISKKDWNRKLTFNDWWNNPVYSREKERFIQVVSKQLSLREQYISSLVSKYVDQWKDFFQSAEETRNSSYPKFARLVGQKIKIEFFPKSAPRRIEDLLATDLVFLSSGERQDVYEVGREMFLGTKR